MDATRKYYLDWLRILAFALLIVFHVGLMYSNWGYVFKSPRTAPEIEWLLFVFYPWRILILFFISGVACRFLIDKMGAVKFSKDRLLRLLPVLVIGILIINPTQSYFEVLTDGTYEGGYIEFWLGRYLVGDSSLGQIFPTWDHLWFLAYILVYALVLAASYSLIARVYTAKSSGRFSPALTLVVPFTWLAASNYLVSEVNPATFDFVSDWAIHLRSGGVFIAAVVLAKNDHFWSFAVRNAGRLTIASLVVLALMAVLQAGLVQSRPDYWAVATGVYAWLSILALVGWSAKYLSEPSRALSYLTAAILPLYVLHQPMMIMLGYCIFPMKIPFLIEGVLIALLTVAGSFIIYELLIKRFRIMRLAFGLK